MKKERGAVVGRPRLESGARIVHIDTYPTWRRYLAIYLPFGVLYFGRRAVLSALLLYGWEKGCKSSEYHPHVEGKLGSSDAQTP